MKKRELSKIPRPKATQEMIALANNLENMNYIGTVEKAHLDNKKVLILNLFKIATLKNNNSEAELRIFFTDTDYITQDLTVSNIRWKTSSIRYMNMYTERFTSWVPEKMDYRSTIFVFSEEEQKKLEEFFKQYIREQDLDILSAILRFQDKVMERKLEEKHRKETDPIDALMETVGEVPTDFFNWINEETMSFSHYLFYKAKNKREVEAVCSHCKKKIIFDRTKHRVYNNEKGMCPSCGKKVTYKARGKCGLIRDERWASYVEPRAEGFLWRYFLVIRIYNKEQHPIFEQHIFEEARAFMVFKNGKIENDNYEYIEFKQSGKVRWCHAEGRIPCISTTLYYKNLPEVWKDTPLKYSALEILSKNNPGKSFRYERLMKEYLEYPFLEWFIKMGLSNLVKHVIERYSSNVIDYDGKTIYDILKLNKVNTRILQQLDGGWGILRLLQASQEIGFTFKAYQLKEYYETFECNTELLKQANRKTTLHKIVRYIEKESENYGIGDRGERWNYSFNRYNEREDIRIERKQNMAHDWLEYLDWCKALKYDLNNMFIYMPRNFKTVHDRTAQEYQELLDKKAAKEKKRREREAKRKMEQTKKAMAEIFAENADVKDAFAIKGKGLILRVPQSADEIKEEGSKLHHCVGTYVERVARGETMILFIRKAADPDTPYYTMEWQNNRVVQCRGSHNKDMTAEVKAFVEVFEKKMLENIGKKKKVS